MIRDAVVISLMLLVIGWGCYMFWLIYQIEKIKNRLNRPGGE